MLFLKLRGKYVNECR